MTDDNTDAYERLKNIEQTVEAIASENPIEKLKPRMDITPGSLRWDLLKFVKNNAPTTVSDVKHIGDANTTRELTSLYRTFALNRKKNGNGKYVYEITNLGERMLQTEQSRLGETSSEPEDAAPKPWVGTELSESEYKLLEIIDEAPDAPQSREVDETFVERTPVGEGNCTSGVVTPYLTKLFRAEFLDRTPIQPYRYWVTEKGKDVLNG